MALVQLICPHCGGPFHLEDEKTLQPRWQCPYCNRRSLIDRDGDNIRLRGILSGESKAEGSEILPAENMPSTQEAQDAKGDIANDGSPEDGDDGADEAILEEAVAEDKAPVPSDDAGPVEEAALPSQPVMEPNLIEQAIEAARQHDLPQFNSLSRKILDENPKEARIFAWRAILTEKADGFATYVWTDPGWSRRLPWQRRQLVAQHFYALSHALQFEPNPADRQSLLERIAASLCEQIIRVFEESMRQRLPRHKQQQPLKGKYRRRDLEHGPALVHALRDLTAVLGNPDGPELHRIVLECLSDQDAALKRKLEKHARL